MARKKPVSYDEKFINKVQDYLKTKEDTQEKGNRVKVNLPTVEGFARYLGVSRRVLYKWRDKYPDFEIALDEILVEQQERLINNGLSTTYNQVITKLLLSHNHGFKERSDYTSDNKPIPLMDYASNSGNNNGDEENPIS